MQFFGFLTKQHFPPCSFMPYWGSNWETPRIPGDPPNPPLGGYGTPRTPPLGLIWGLSAPSSTSFLGIGRPLYPVPWEETGLGWMCSHNFFLSLFLPVHLFVRVSSTHFFLRPFFCFWRKFAFSHDFPRPFFWHPHILYFVLPFLLGSLHFRAPARFFAKYVHEVFFLDEKNVCLLTRNP